MSSRGQPAPSPPLAGWIPATRRTTAPTSRDPVRVLPRSASDDFSRHRSAQTGPREAWSASARDSGPRRRLRAARARGSPHGARRTTRPRKPCRNARVSSASTMRWRWSSCALKWITRKPRWEAAPSALRTAGKTRAARRQRTTGPQRSVTCTGHEAMCAGRVQCGTPGRRPGVGFRPAPRRRPPQVRGDGSDSCKERATLIRR